jgi:hypothetical protein
VGAIVKKINENINNLNKLIAKARALTEENIKNVDAMPEKIAAEVMSMLKSSPPPPNTIGIHQLIGFEVARILRSAMPEASEDLDVRGLAELASSRIRQANKLP